MKIFQNQRVRTRIEKILLLTPFLVWFCVFVVYPVFNCVLLSFKEDYNLLTQTYSGIGFENYQDVLTDEFFHQAFKNTFLYVLICVPVSIVLALVIAGILCGNLKFKTFFQTAIFLPMVTSVSAIGYSWRLMFNDSYGVVNYVVTSLGLEKIRWLSDPDYSMIPLVIYGVWSMLPMTVLLLVNAMNSIPNRLYHAALIDGARGTQRFWRITIPNIKGTIALLIFTNVTSSLKVFDELYPLFSGKPGPAYNMHTIVYYIYSSMQGPHIYGYGKAAAAAVVLLVLSFIIVGIFSVVRRREESQ